MPAENVVGIHRGGAEVHLLRRMTGSFVCRPFCGVGRYGTAGGGRNGANYLIDFNPAMVTPIHEGRWSQDKIETPASVPRQWVRGSRLSQFRGLVRRDALPSRCQ